MSRQPDAHDEGEIQPEIAVVIPALNAAATISRQIHAVLQDRDDHTELVLVDNGSTDETLKVMHSATTGFERITIVQEPRRGVNFARNAGIAATTSRFILLCDADDEIEPGWISALSTALRSNDLVGGALRKVSHEGQLLGDPELPDARDRFGWGIAHAWGGNCGLRRDVWEELGGFDPRMSGGGDESDFFIRAQIDGFSFAWTEQAVVRYTLRGDPEQHARLRWKQGWRNTTRAYWHGRLRGWPRYGHLCIDLAKSALLLPLAPFSGHWRSVIGWRMARRRGRFAGTLTFLPGELRQRIGENVPRPSRFTETRRFRRDWRNIDQIDGWLARTEAAALHAAASRVLADQTIVEIGSWKGRSTAALALGCQRRRAVFAVDPHTGGRSYVEANLPVDSLEHFERTIANLDLHNVTPIVSTSHDGARAYSGKPIGLLFIDGWHSTDAVVDDYRWWSPHLAAGATIVFDDRTHAEVRAAILKLRPSLPSRMLEIGKMSVFTDV